MAAEIPDYEPVEFVGGDTVEWTKVLADYPASSWTLKYRLIAGDVDSTITATEDGDSYEVEIPPATTAAIVTETVGRLVGWVTDGTDRHYVYDATVRVRPNIETATATNLKTHAVRTLAVIEAALENRLTADMESYSIDGRQVTKIPIKELRRLRGLYAAEVWREQNEDESHPTHAIEFTNAD